MSDGHGCDAGGHNCGFEVAGANPAGDAGYDVAVDGRTPIPNIKSVTINGAPVVEAAYEFVIKRAIDAY